MATTYTKVIFNTDAKIKAKAMKEAKKQGLSLTYFLNQTIHDVASGEKRAEVIERVNKETLKRIEKARVDIKKGKGLSPKFKSLEEGFAWLDA